MNKILIRADGSKNIGMGHLNRCLLIADYLFVEKNTQSIIVVKHDFAAQHFITSKNTSSIVYYIDERMDAEHELAYIEETVLRESVDIILLDLLEVHLTDAYLGGLHQNNLPISVITDDSEYRAIDVNLILNGNPNQCDFDYSHEKGQYLLGPLYFIMDSSYALPASKSINEGISILLSLGGSDHNDLIFNILNIVDRNPLIKKIIIITSRATGYFDELMTFVNNLSKEIIIYHDVPTLYPYWQQCDLAVTAGGNTLFERIASGTPGATVCQLNRQMEIAEKFEEIGVNKNLGYGPGLDPKTLRVSLDSFIADKYNHSQQQIKCRKVVPGNGLQLFTNKLYELIGNKNELR